MKALQTAIDRAGSQAALAVLLKVSPQAVNQWVRQRRPVPIHHVFAIEKWSGGSITRAELRPDIFGEQAA
jgi:DNA-binding transcriptional regulator YdaS (Cro superfamily)